MKKDNSALRKWFRVQERERSESTSRGHLGLVDIDASKGGTVARYQPDPVPVEGCKPGCDSLFRVTREAHDTRGSVRGGWSKGDVVHGARLGVDAPPFHSLGKHLTSDRGRWGSSSSSAMEDGVLTVSGASSKSTCVASRPPACSARATARVDGM